VSGLDRGWLQLPTSDWWSDLDPHLTLSFQSQDWLLSIDSWSSKFAHQNDVAGGVSSILYAINLTYVRPLFYSAPLLSHPNFSSFAIPFRLYRLVQIFWCGCIFKMMASRPKFRLACVALIALTSLGSVSIAFSLGVILLNQSSDGISAAHCEIKRILQMAASSSDHFLLLTPKNPQQGWVERSTVWLYWPTWWF